MSLNLEVFKTISEKKKKYVFGYIRRIENEYNIEIPMIVYQICALFCMVYWEWSPEWKGEKMILSENNTKVTRGLADESVRANHPILKGMYVKFNYVCGGGAKGCDIIGVISSEFDDKEGFCKDPQSDATIRKYCYGADCYPSNYALNRHYYDGKYEDLGWSLGQKTKEKSVTICMIIDYQTYDTCCLSYYIDGQFKGPKNGKYSMKLPKLKDDHVWYPVTSLRYSGCWCKIVCVD